MCLFWFGGGLGSSGMEGSQDDWGEEEDMMGEIVDMLRDIRKYLTVTIYLSFWKQRQVDGVRMWKWR